MLPPKDPNTEDDDHLHLPGDDEQDPPADDTEQQEDQEDQSQGDDEQDPPADDTEQQEDGDDEGEAPAPQRRQSRGANRHQSLSNRAREAEQRARDAEAEVRRLSALNQPRERTAAEEQEYLATLTPEERIEYRLEKAERRNQAAEARRNFDTFEAADQMKFRGTLQDYPKFKRYEQEVEDMLADMRSKGQNAPRETVLKYILGDKILNGANAPQRKKTKEQANRRVKDQQAPGGNSRGDKTVDRRNTGKTPEERLTGVQI